MRRETRTTRAPAQQGTDIPSNIGHAAHGASSPLAPFEFDRPSMDPEDVRIDIKFCGICHVVTHDRSPGSGS